MESTIKHFKSLLPCEQFVVTGSYVLALNGLVDMTKVKDLDIILVNPTSESLGIIARLMEDAPAKTKPTGTTSLKAILMHDKTKIDFFVVDKKQSTLQLPDFEIAKVDSIVAAKKSYKRMKDELQLRKIAQLFFNQNEFVKFLDAVEIKAETEYGDQ